MRTLLGASLAPGAAAGVRWPACACAVIPCRDEAAAIAEVVAQAQAILPQVIVVDDGSSDGTADAAARAGAETIRRPKNFGKGAALKAGLAHAQARGFLWAILLDGDGQHSPSDIPKLFACAQSTGARMVIGNRMLDPRAMPIIRRWTNRIMSRMLSRRAGRPLPDSQCGLRLVHIPTWIELDLKSDRFEIESESLMEMARRGYPVAFAPIQTIYRRGASKIQPLRDAWRWVRWWRQSARRHL